jgi:hypothetical protein
MRVNVVMIITELTVLNIEDILPKHCGMDLQVHLHHKYGSFHHNFSLPMEPQVWNQYDLANELHPF